MIINDSVYGRQTIDDPLVLEIMATPEMQRLRGLINMECGICLMRNILRPDLIMVWVFIYCYDS